MSTAHFVFQLVYASIGLRPFSGTELEQLLLEARRNNTRSGLTGVLLYEGGMFIQALEGDEGSVREVFAKIAKDPRHGRVQELWSGEVTARSFGDWTMGFVNGGSADVKNLEGYRDFFGKQSLTAFWTNPSRATDLLREFRQLPWRMALDAQRPQQADPRP